MTEQAQWEKTTGLAPESTRISLTCSKQERDQWSEEATEQGYSSRSKYLYDLIQEARAYRKEGFLAHHDSDRQIKQLEAEVDALEEEITRLKRKQGGRIAVDDPEFLEKFLDDSYKSLEELLQDIVESGALDDLVRKRVGKQLYYLAAQNTVEYEPGWGWKLSTTEE